jgi:hypothetical protein
MYAMQKLFQLTEWSCLQKIEIKIPIFYMWEGDPITHRQTTLSLVLAMSQTEKLNML